MMKPSRITVLVGGIYTLILGILLIILSSVSMVAYKCTFHDGFMASPEAYFFHLFYFRSRHCNRTIDWSIVGLENSEIVQEALRMPDEIGMVSRTYQLALIQLIINCILVAASIVILATVAFHIYFVSRRLTYWLIFAPYCLIFHIAIVYDFVAGTYFGDDRLRSYSTDGAMAMLEIYDRDAGRPFMEQIDVNYRIVAPNVMFFISTKAIIVPIISCFVLFFIIFAGWEVIDGNKLRVKKDDEKPSDEQTQLSVGS